MKDCKFKLPVKRDGAFLRDADDATVVCAKHSAFWYDEDDAHISHIAKCVNLHEELVKALEIIPCERLFQIACFLDDYDKLKGLTGHTEVQDSLRKMALISFNVLAKAKEAQ